MGIRHRKKSVRLAGGSDIWPIVYRQLRAIGIEFESISRLTIPQVIHLLNLESAAAENHSASEKRAAVFQRICKQNRWTVSRLLDLPVEELERQIKHHGGGMVDKSKVSTFVNKCKLNLSTVGAVHHTSLASNSGEQ